MDYEINQLVRDEILPDENIIWSGRPDLAKRLGRIDILIILYNCILTPIILVKFFKFANEFSPFMINIFIISMTVFVFFGLIVIFLYKFYLKKRMYYYITNKRILVLKNLKRKRIQTANIVKTLKIVIEKNKNGKGAIFFGNIPALSFLYGGNQFPFGRYLDYYFPVFYCIDDVELAEQHINQVIYDLNSN